MSTADPPTLASAIERRLAREIMRGERPPGSQLPPLRTLARQHRVTLPTVQRVVDRLEAGGLVSARRGSGVTVNDPGRSGDLSLLPLWFEALADQPERAAAMLADFLELRRVVAAHLVKGAARRIAPAVSAPLAALALALADGDTLAIADADLALSAAVVDAAGQLAVAAVFHTTARLVREVPHVADALYGDRARYRRMLRRLGGALAGARTDAAAELEAALAAWDRGTVARFRASLTAAPRALRRRP
jgi:DNA-binding FadR family transcriptional regulator